jgi:hypothetical protein
VDRFGENRRPIVHFSTLSELSINRNWTGIVRSRRPGFFRPADATHRVGVSAVVFEVAIRWPSLTHQGEHQSATHQKRRESLAAPGDDHGGHRMAQREWRRRRTLRRRSLRDRFPSFETAGRESLVISDPRNREGLQLSVKSPTSVEEGAARPWREREPSGAGNVLANCFSQRAKSRRAVSPSPPRGGRWPEGPDEGDRAERDGSERATRAAIARRSAALCYISKVSGGPRSHLAPLDPPCIRHCFAMTPSPARGEG